MTRTDGIHTESDLRARCRVDKATGCWHWLGAQDVNGCASLYLPALRKTTSLGVAIAVLRTGKAPERGVVWHCTCTTRNCGNPAHRTAGTRSTQMLAARLERTPQVRARMAVGRRKAGKLSDADVAAVVAAKGKLRDIADRFGICVGYACCLRRGKARAVALADDVRVTVRTLPAEPDAPRLFRSLVLGEYLPGDSAIARALAARTEGGA